MFKPREGRGIRSDRVNSLVQAAFECGTSSDSHPFGFPHRSFEN
ncbi:hypothetical protein RRSWK_03395 [Rhodopirellula sp. SWK7]|nr:hypothetical protein RRSWK_03395 [Rhodopirellula sp. SWK7]